MPASKMKGGKTVVTLYEQEKRRFREVIDTLVFCERNAEPDSELEVAANTACGSIRQVLELLTADTPEAVEV